MNVLSQDEKDSLPWLDFAALRPSGFAVHCAGAAGWLCP